jgi:hypothetical protein
VSRNETTTPNDVFFSVTSFLSPGLAGTNFFRGISSQVGLPGPLIPTEAWGRRTCGAGRMTWLPLVGRLGERHSVSISQAGRGFAAGRPPRGPAAGGASAGAVHIIAYGRNEETFPFNM